NPHIRVRAAIRLLSGCAAAVAAGRADVFRPGCCIPRSPADGALILFLGAVVPQYRILRHRRSFGRRNDATFARRHWNQLRIGGTVARYHRTMNQFVSRSADAIAPLAAGRWSRRDRRELEVWKTRSCVPSDPTAEVPIRYDWADSCPVCAGESVDGQNSHAIADMGPRERR